MNAPAGPAAALPPTPATPATAPAPASATPAVAPAAASATPSASAPAAGGTGGVAGRPERPYKLPGAVLLLVAMALLHTGGALATELFDSLGPAGTTWLRLTLAAVVLLACTGRSLWRVVRTTARADLLGTVGLGVVSAAMMLLFAEAAARLPLGTATALEFLGPLAVAVAGSRRVRELLWLALAAAGVLLLTSPWSGSAGLVGVLFGLGSAACWAAYVIGTAHVGSRFSAPHGLALSLAVAAVVAAPFGAPGALAHLSWQVAAAAAGIAVLMPLLPFLLEMKALQRMSKTTYGTLAGLEPAVALFAGMVLIAQTPTVLQAAGTALVVTAGIGAARGEGRR
ncbi:EamA family transporter [Streptomyces antimicrobicus]|uniref:EamA family transporter n=1 Tax=Streptomyces antimicrobicus TaxID=2883108 RepID=A0ABS8BB59_9ACTN|nr:EamA family transporter [Streptomyces antimicrobicus]MCB5181844.1 EamA family transporter [Streptomyces antimicrobicus]